MLSTIAHRLQPFVPSSLYRSAFTYMGRRTGNNWLENEGIFELAQKVADKFNYTVQSGPFKGMKYTRDAVLSRHAVPHLVGQYERQIYPALMLAASRAKLVVDIGHAEGYYAVGFAMLGKFVIAFDADPHERKICRGMAAANVVKVSIERWCSPETLQGLATKGPLVISDIDGGEIDLFTAETITSLNRCDLIIEMHAATTEENSGFADRFRDTHVIQVVDHPSKPIGVEMLSFLGSDAERVASEYRPFQQWLVARPKIS